MVAIKIILMIIHLNKGLVILSYILTSSISLVLKFFLTLFLTFLYILSNFPPSDSSLAISSFLESETSIPFFVSIPSFSFIKFNISSFVLGTSTSSPLITDSIMLSKYLSVILYTSLLVWMESPTLLKVS